MVKKDYARPTRMIIDKQETGNNKEQEDIKAA